MTDRRGRFAVAAVVVLAVAAAAWWLTAQQGPNETRRSETDGRVVDFLASDDGGDYREVVPGVPVVFPDDHGPHPEFRQEWWYFTGNVATTSGRRFGFQLTFFRFAHGARDEYRDSAWRHEHSYMAHFAVSDVAGKRLLAEQDYARGSLDLAGALADPFRVWVNGWSARAPAGRGEGFAARLSANGDAAAIDIEVSTDAAPLLQGEDGYSVKDGAGATASYYYSFPDLAARGTLTVGGESFEVEGRAWMDREWSTRVLSRDLDGWDWFALRTSDGSAIMVFQVRGAGGHRYAVVVDGQGGAMRYAGGEVRVEPRRWWTSGDSGARYPVGWRLSIPGAGVDLEVDAAFDAQELNLDFRYYEGVVDVAGAVDNRPVSGEGYMELTGY